MTAKEAEFFARVRKNRVDPTVGASTGNPGMCFGVFPLDFSLPTMSVSETWKTTSS